jgi:hypothetical protein
MVKYNVRAYAYIIIGLAFVTYFILFLTSRNLSKFDINIAIRDFSYTVGVNIVIWIIFIKWIWKCQLFYDWLVPFPNVQGKWEGEIFTRSKDSTTVSIPVELTINQSFFHLSILLSSTESESNSIAAFFNIDKERGIRQVIYSYGNTPKPLLRERSQIHFGTTMLKFHKVPVNEMEGEYWTSRGTFGEIKIKRVDK